MKTPLYLITALLLLFLLTIKSSAQSYHALSGSSYAGATSMYNNPAATVNAAFNWDVTLLSMQSSIANTAFVVKNNSLTSANNSRLFISSGTAPRYFNNNFDLNLLNFRFKINKKSAFAAGVRLRSYTNIEGDPFAYSDTMNTLQRFLYANSTVNQLQGYLTHAAWAEFKFNYSRILIQNQESYLSAGMSLSYLKGLSGAFANLSNIAFTVQQQNGANYYILNQASIAAEYSNTYPAVNSTNTSTQIIKNFIQKSLPSIGVDIGAEYLFKDYENVDDEPVDAKNYDWKIGFSIMDIGSTKFNPVQGSFAINSAKQNITDSVLQQRLAHVTSIQSLKDTLHNLFNLVDSLHSPFKVSLPTRVVVSVDRSIGANFYVNAEASLSFYSAKQASNLKTSELNLLTVTPRWETKAWGIYLPMQYNARGLLWVGAAVKLGPLLIGVHSLDFTKWFKTGTQTYNGGGYILLSVHPFGHRQKEEDKLPCPKV